MYKKSLLNKHNLCTFSSLCFYEYSEPCHLQNAPENLQIAFLKTVQIWGISLFAIYTSLHHYIHRFDSVFICVTQKVLETMFFIQLSENT
jgi:hypothetical protein